MLVFRGVAWNPKFMVSKKDLLKGVILSSMFNVSFLIYTPAEIERIDTKNDGLWKMYLLPKMVILGIYLLNFGGVNFDIPFQTSLKFSPSGSFVRCHWDRCPGHPRDPLQSHYPQSTMVLQCPCRCTAWSSEPRFSVKQPRRPTHTLF